MPIKIQVSEPSPCHGSFFRIANVEGVQRCNICGLKCPTVYEEPDKSFIKQSTARKWSKKKHRFLKEGEV